MQVLIIIAGLDMEELHDNEACEHHVASSKAYKVEYCKMCIIYVITD